MCIRDRSGDPTQLDYDDDEEDGDVADAPVGGGKGTKRKKVHTAAAIPRAHHGVN